MNYSEVTKNECPECSNGSGHCYGKVEYCTCGCKFNEPRKEALRYFEENHESLSLDLRNKYLEDKTVFVERVINRFEAINQDNYHTNSQMRQLFSDYLETVINDLNQENLNKSESRTRLS